MEGTILEGVKNTLLVLSGKGGVGKSTSAVQLALTLSANGHKVGILDIDLCGPSIPKMLNLEEKDVFTVDGKWIPVYTNERKNLGVISISFFLKSTDDAIIWRGPKKNAMIKQLLSSVHWDVDYLIIDTPPGTSDEHISVMENLKAVPVMGAVLVTTPQMVAIDDVTREITFCRRTGIKILGLIENMSGFICPNCADCTKILATGGGEKLAEKSKLPFLGSVPIDPNLAMCTSNGSNYLDQFPNSPILEVYKSIVNKILSIHVEL